MDTVFAAAGWVASHPLLVLGAVVAFAAVVSLAGRLRAAARRRRAARVRLRTPKEQGRFNPVSTVYAPKQYRRPRN